MREKLFVKLGIIDMRIIAVGVADSHLFQEDSSLLQRKQREKKLNVKKTSAFVISDCFSNKWDKP